MYAFKGGLFSIRPPLLKNYIGISYTPHFLPLDQLSTLAVRERL